MELSTEIVSLLFLVGAVAGFVDAIAGGGGLITIPILMLSGMNPIQALGTNKFQASFGSFSASMHFRRRGLLHIRSCLLAIVSVALASVAGSYAVQKINTELLLRLMPALFIAIALYTLFNKGMGNKSMRQWLSSRTYSVSMAPAIGFYDGFAGPGTGTFFAVSMVKLRGMDFLRATAQAKVLNFTSNVCSLSVFVAAGQVVWLAGLAMAAGQFFGAFLGAHTAIVRGAGFIRLVTAAVCIATSISLLLKN